MFARLEVLDHTPEGSAERQEIEKALGKVRLMKKSILHFS